MSDYGRLVVFAASVLLAATVAGASTNHYGLTISTTATHDVSFNNGVFTATGDEAVLNINDLENALASGSTKVTTDNGSGGDQNGDLHVEAPLSWTSASTLTLDAFHSIFVDQPVSVDGVGGITIVTNDGGTAGLFSIGKNGHGFNTAGHITFASLSSMLWINAVTYTLEGDIKGLAAAIADDPVGAYALAADYDASADGTYTSAPVPTYFTGNFDGLGNTISHLTIDAPVGLFWNIAANVAHLKLRKLKTSAVVSRGGSPQVGGLASSSTGSLFEDSVTGSITVTIETERAPGGYDTCGDGCDIGGLIGINEGQIDSAGTGVSITFTGPGGAQDASIGGLVGADVAYNSDAVGAITNSRATANITTTSPAAIGGLVGAMARTYDTWASVATSYATVDISCTKSCGAGGLVGGLGLGSSVANSYATGTIAGTGKYENIGGLIGLIGQGSQTDVSVANAYSTGAPTGGEGSVVGGFIGYDGSSFGQLESCYWDLDTSGITDPSQGAGYPSNDTGITGYTTKQLKSGLPAGFDPAIWAEKKHLNGGLPYLISNPPPE